MVESAFTAPGKAVIAGEYAVLRGAPAIAMAVDRRAVVHAVPSGGDCSSVETPGLANGRWSFRVSGNEVEWLDARGPAIIDAVFSVLGRRAAVHCDITIDTRTFVDKDSGCKLGLGSSAAATTALIAALVSSGTARPDSLALARAAHLKLQGGKGSGVDVATSYEGGLVTFVRDGGVQDRPAWPAGLHYRYFFSGKSASTSDAIARTEAIPDTDAILLALVASAGDAAIAMASGNVDDAILAIGAYSRALKSFDETHRLGIFAAGHETMTRRAADIGAVYKPCGAGGGDIGIALDPDQDRLEALTEKAAGEGFVSLDLQMDNDGVRQETLAGL